MTDADEASGDAVGRQKSMSGSRDGISRYTLRKYGARRRLMVRGCRDPAPYCAHHRIGQADTTLGTPE